jgi:hypothetical protein
MLSKAKLDAYVMDKGHAVVEGWLEEGAASATIGLSQIQAGLGTKGDIAEIGVHHGKYFILLANLRKPGERAVAVDVFEDQYLNVDHSGCGDRKIFERNLQHFSDVENVVVIKSDSRLLTPKMLLGGGAGVRLFSVDGSHTASYTDSDLNFATSVLVEGGLVILDDFYNPDWPGVQEGFYRFMRTHGDRFAPIAYGCNKLFIVHRSHHAIILDKFLEMFGGFFSHFKEVEIAGCRAVHFYLPIPEDIFDKDYNVVENTFRFGVARPGGRCQLGKGWSAPEPAGVWSAAEQASLELQLVALVPGHDYVLHLTAKAFLHQKRTVRKVRVQAGAHEIGWMVMDSDDFSRYSFPLDRVRLLSPLSITFTIESPESPADFTGSKDRRTLGLLLREVRIMPAR